MVEIQPMINLFAAKESTCCIVPNEFGINNYYWLLLIGHDLGEVEMSFAFSSSMDATHHFKLFLSKFLLSWSVQAQLISMEQ